MRACYGAFVSAAIGIIVTLFTKPEPKEKQRGLVWGTIADALRHYKGSPGKEARPTRALASLCTLEGEADTVGAHSLAVVHVSRALAESLETVSGDLVYLTDKRLWTGGLFSSHAVVGEVREGDKHLVWAGEDTAKLIRGSWKKERLIRVERLYASV
jgi:hypothetical protein